MCFWPFGPLFLSTLSLRRATATRQIKQTRQAISIHALLAESDRRHRGNDRCPVHFYPRSPCGERRKPRALKSRRCVFLSTLSLRRATSGSAISESRYRHFYPRSPCGERQPGERHASSQQEFLSTLSLRRATRVKSGQQRSPRNFYPRSPCGERPSSTVIVILRKNFYPRSPCGERPKSAKATAFPLSFLSTLSLRRATNVKVRMICSDTHFYPRSPCGERQ